MFLWCTRFSHSLKSFMVNIRGENVYEKEQLNYSFGLVVFASFFLSPKRSAVSVWLCKNTRETCAF